MSEEACINCGHPVAVAYCDFPIGTQIGGFQRIGKVEENKFWAYTDCSKQPFTCDVAMCEACLTRVGGFHISGKEPFSDSIDHCPLHRSEPASACKPITDDEATVLRRDIWAHYRRKAFAKVNT